VVPYIRSISPRAEFTVVFIFAFGYFILGSILSLMAPPTSEPIYDDGLRSLFSYELAVFAFLAGFLWLRGWNHRKIGLKPTLGDTGMGVVLTIVAYIIYFIIWHLVVNFFPNLGQHADGLVEPNLSLSSVVFLSLINPVFEEVFVCGYVVTFLKEKHSMTFAINTSITIRLAYHLYQGAVGVINIIPLGLIFTYWYAKTGRLWPLIVAHAIFDFVALAPYVTSN
jgi:uncharacterized protein